MLSGREHGASIMLVTATMLLLLGMAAIAIDVGAGFNERRSNQTSSDVGVIAGMIDFLALGECGSTNPDLDGGCNRALEVIRDNLTEWITDDGDYAAVWRGCSDPNKPVGFSPLPTSGVPPWDGFVGRNSSGIAFNDAIDCISASQTELRVRLPRQLTDANFGRVLGVEELATSAFAHAGYDLGSGPNPIIPFGVLAASVGYDCLLQPPNGFADPPCVGGETGSYGALLTQLWGSAGSIANCGPSSWPPGANQLMFSIAYGMDHPLAPLAQTELDALPASADAFDQGVNTGDADIDELTVLDRCTYVGGEVVGWDQLNGNAPDAGPVDTVRVDSGASMSDATLKGFITGDTADFTGRSTDPSNLEARIRHSTDCSGPYGDEKLCLTVGSQDYLVDNVPLWAHLVDEFSIDDFGCDDDDDGMVTNSEEMDCVLRSPSLSGPIFDDSIQESLRFVWVPEFHYTSWGTGVGWQPIARFKSAYVHAFWFNTPGPGGEHRWAPGEVFGSHTVPITNPNALITVTAFLIPDHVLPAAVAGGCPTCENAPFDIELRR